MRVVWRRGFRHTELARVIRAQSGAAGVIWIPKERIEINLNKKSAQLVAQCETLCNISKHFGGGGRGCPRYIYLSTVLNFTGLCYLCNTQLRAMLAYYL